MESALIPHASSALSTLLGGQASSAITPVATQALTGAATQGLNSLIGGNSPKVLYHGTDKVFDKFDERLPSVWFTDSDKNIAGTGLNVRDTSKINVMKRTLPSELKIADEDLADRLTKQQLQDRGFAGISYPGRGDDGSETYYEIFNPNETLLPYEEPVVQPRQESDRIIAPEFVERANSGAPQEEIIIPPQVQQYLGGQGGFGTFSQDINRVGSSQVAPINRETLPQGWDTLEKYLSTSNKRVENAIGKSTSKITKQDLIKFNSEMGYDTEGTKNELWRAAQDAVDDQILDDLYMEGSSAADIIATRKGRSDLGSVEDLYLGAKGRTGRLDAELSDRLGIGRSNTPMLDRLNKASGRAMGDYAAGAIGSDPLWATGEYGVNTVGHERLHAFQGHAGLHDYDPAVSDAFYDLENELIPLLHNESEIKAAHPTGDVKYWGRRDEQEARMFQDYLEYKNYTQKHFGGKREYEYGEEIIEPFDKFIKKLQELSKKGIALPALGLLFGGATVAAEAGANGKPNRVLTHLPS